MENTSIFVYGASGHGKVVAEAARAAGWLVRGFVDQDNSKKIGGLPTFSEEEFVKRFPGAYLALGIGDNGTREGIYRRLKSEGFCFPAVIHPKAIIAFGMLPGEGAVIMPGVVINPDARIGVGCIINSGAVVEHDCVIGDFVHISPSVALGGNVTVGDKTHLGIASSVIQGIVIGKEVIVGAGAAVIRDLPDRVKAIGVPAKVKEKL